VTNRGCSSGEGGSRAPEPGINAAILESVSAWGGLCWRSCCGVIRTPEDLSGRQLSKIVACGSDRRPLLAHLDILLEAILFLPRMSTKEQKERIELLQGTLDLLILRTLLLGPTHGHAIAKAIECNSDDVLQVEQGSLYPALHRLIKRGWISAEEGTSENNRRAKFYRLTAKGRRQLAIETSKWEKLAGAIARVLRPLEQEGKS
jgi:PadR family transcriptional regulator PadR